MCGIIIICWSLFSSYPTFCFSSVSPTVRKVKTERQQHYIMHTRTKLGSAYKMPVVVYHPRKTTTYRIVMKLSEVACSAKPSDDLAHWRHRSLGSFRTIHPRNGCCWVNTQARMSVGGGISTTRNWPVGRSLILTPVVMNACRKMRKAPLFSRPQFSASAAICFYNTPISKAWCCPMTSPATTRSTCAVPVTAPSRLCRTKDYQP